MENIIVFDELQYFIRNSDEYQNTVIEQIKEMMKTNHINQGITEGIHKKIWGY